MDEHFEHFVRLHVEYAGSYGSATPPSSHLLRGTADDIAAHITKIISSGLSSGGITRIEANPIAPYNVWPVKS